MGKKDKVDIKGHLKNLIVGIWSEGERTIPREKREMGVTNTNMTEKIIEHIILTLLEYILFNICIMVV